MDHVRIFTGKDGDVYFEVRGDNNKVIDTSEGYTRHEDAVRAVQEHHAGLEVKDEVKDE